MNMVLSCFFEIHEQDTADSRAWNIRTRVAAIEDSPSPLRHWTREELQKLRIKRLFRLTCYVESKPAMIGSELIRYC